MTIRTTVKVEGFRELDQALGALKKTTAKAIMRRVAIKAMEPMAETARGHAPDDPNTGPPHDLKSSIIVSAKQKSGRSPRRAYEKNNSLTVVNVYMGPSSFGYPQAIVQEFGTVHHPAHPYMRPAWDKHAMPMLDFLKPALWAEIEKTAKRQAARTAKLAAKG